MFVAPARARRLREHRRPLQRDAALAVAQRLRLPPLAPLLRGRARRGLRQREVPRGQERGLPSGKKEIQQQDPIDSFGSH